MSFQAGILLRLRAGLHSAAGVQGTPPQQFSVRKPTRRVHRLEPRRIDHRAAVAAHRDKPGHSQPVEMERQRVGREVERVGDRAGRHSLRAGLHQQAEYIEPIILGERGQRRDGICLFHISTIIEMSTVVKALRNARPAGHLLSMEIGNGPGS